MGRAIPKPRRRTLGALAPEARRLHFECGRSAEEIAAELGADVVAIAEELAHLVRRQRHKRARDAALNRPRSRREQAALSEWDRSPDDVADAAAGPAPTAETTPPTAAIVAAEPTVWDGPISPVVGRIDGSVIRRGPARPKPGAPRQDDNALVKLTAADRDEARRLAREEGWGYRRLARHFGVNPRTMRRLLRGETWASDRKSPTPTQPPTKPIGVRLGGPPPAPSAYERRKPTAANAKLSPEQRAEARELARQGWGLKRLARRFGVNPSTIRRMLLGMRYADDPGAPPPPPRPRPRPERWNREPGNPMHRDPEPPAELLHQVVIIEPPAIAEEDEPGPGDGMEDGVEAEWYAWDE